METGNYFVNSINHFRKLENSLGTVQNDLRIGLYNQLIAGYIFIDLSKAGKLIDDLGRQIKELSSEEQWYYLYNRAWYENQKYHYSLASELYGNLLAQIHLIHRDSVKVELYLDYAGTAINTHAFDLAKELLQKSKVFIDSLDLSCQRARYYIRKGYIALNKNKYSNAMDYFYKAERLYSDYKNEMVLKDQYFSILLYSGFGNLYEKNNEIKKSIKAYKKVLNISNKNSIETKKSWYYLNVGKGCMAVSEIERAINFFTKGLKTTNNGFDHSKPSLLSNLGYCYLKLKDYPRSLEYFNEAEELYDEYGLNESINMAILYRWKGILYCRMNEYEYAEIALANAFEIANSNNDIKQLANICKEVAAFYSDIGDFENAYEYMLLNAELSETFLEEINDRKIAELEVKYQVGKQKENSELLKMKAVNLQLKALRAQMNPHFMYNALNAIQSFVTSNRKKEAVKYLAKFAKLMRQSLEYSNVETISIEKEVIFLGDYLEINKNLRFEDNLNYSIIVDDELDEDICIPTMIVQPYVENAIEHGLRLVKDGHIVLSFEYLDDENILCIIEDNGVGREKTKQLQMQDSKYKEHKSRGTSITEKRLSLLHEKYDNNQVYVNIIDLYNEKTGDACGTRVQIVLPAKESSLIDDSF